MTTLDPQQFLADVATYTRKRDDAEGRSNRGVRFGVIDPTYTSGDPKVKFDGDTVMSNKTFKCIDYTPVPSDRVVLLPAGRLGNYVVLGKVGSGNGAAAVGARFHETSPNVWAPNPNGSPGFLSIAFDTKTYGNGVAPVAGSGNKVFQVAAQGDYDITFYSRANGAANDGRVAFLNLSSAVDGGGTTYARTPVYVSVSGFTPSGTLTVIGLGLAAGATISASILYTGTGVNSDTSSYLSIRRRGDIPT